jgi:cytidylate kinase
MPRSGMQNYINGQFAFWQNRQSQMDVPQERVIKPFITISREYGCGGYEVGEKLVEIINKELNPELPWAAYDKKLLDQVMNDLGLSESLVNTLTSNAKTKITNLLTTSFSDMPPQVAVYRNLAKTVALLATNGNAVIIGRAGNIITKALKGGYNIRIVATNQFKTERLMNLMSISKKEAEKMIKEKDNDRDSFIREYVKVDPSNPANYHLLINNSLHTTEEVAKIIIAGIKTKGLI